MLRLSFFQLALYVAGVVILYAALGTARPAPARAARVFTAVAWPAVLPVAFVLAILFVLGLTGQPRPWRGDDP